MKVCVIGAGIVGCSTAYQLATQGFEVQLIDAAPGPGRVTSLANGAQLSYSYVEPLASPHTLAHLPSMLLSRNSPLRFAPQWDWRQWRWGLAFLRACTAAQVQAGTQTLLQLARLSRSTLEQWMAAEDWSFGYRRNGKLVLVPDQAGLARQGQQIAFQKQWGCEQTLLLRSECLAQEPALQHYAERFAGGVWTPDERVADPYRLCLELTRSAQRLGAAVAWDTQLTSWETQGQRVRALHTNQGRVQADAFVLATGSQAARHAALLGLYLPVYPIKGYSITLPVVQSARAPQASVTDLSLKTVFAPLGQSLRVAAMAEVCGHDLTIPAERIQRMLASVQTLFPGVFDVSQPQPWAGLRPATPTSVPIVGRSSFDNLFLNVGHGALGLTLAAGSAALVAQEVEGWRGGR